MLTCIHRCGKTFDTVIRQEFHEDVCTFGTSEWENSPCEHGWYNWARACPHGCYRPKPEHVASAPEEIDRHKTLGAALDKYIATGPARFPYRDCSGHEPLPSTNNPEICWLCGGNVNNHDKQFMTPTERASGRPT